MTLQQSQMSLFEESEVWTLSVEDFRAKLSQLQEIDEVLKIHEELCSLKLLGSHLFSDLDIYSLKTSKDSSTTTEELRSRPSSEPWTNWGTMWNGKCLTAKILVSPKIGNVCSLSDILEEEVPEQYFLSAEMTKRLIANNQKSKKVGNIRKKGKSQSGDVVSVDSLAPTLCSTTTQKDPLKIAIPEIIQKARGFNKGGQHSIAPTLSSNSYHENNVLKIREAVKKGYIEATTGDSINLSFPNSTTSRGRVGKSVANTVLTGGAQGVVTSDFRIRKLTPRECWRLQGFPDWAFDKAQEVNSNSQLYKQAGNSVTVNVIAEIAKRL